MDHLQIIIIFFMAIFKHSGFRKLMNIENTKKTINNKLKLDNETLALLTTYIVIFIELVCTFIIVYYFYDEDKKEYVKYSLYAVILFMILVIIYFHNPFTMENQKSEFLMRLSIIAGLFIILYIHNDL